MSVMFADSENIGYLKLGQLFVVVSPPSIQLYGLLTGRPVTGRNSIYTVPFF